MTTMITLNCSTIKYTINVTGFFTHEPASIPLTEFRSVQALVEGFRAENKIFTKSGS